jgi:hypothetical protein
MAKRSILTSVALTFLLVVAYLGRAAGDSDGSADRAVEIFGEPFGKALIVGIENACEHVNETLEMSPPDERVLLLSDENASKFYRESCDGVCDFVQANNIVTRCRAEQKIEGCVIYGAVYNKEIYDLSVDAYGKKISEDCDG